MYRNSHKLVTLNSGRYFSKGLVVSGQNAHTYMSSGHRELVMLGNDQSLLEVEGYTRD